MDRLSTDVGSAAFSDYGTRLRRRWWVVLLGVVLGLLAGAALLATQPESYTSTTSVLVTPVGPGALTGTTATTSRTGTDINLDTESQIVESAQVGDAVRTLLRTDRSVTDLLADLTVTVPPNSQVLSIAYAAGTAKGAQEGSHAFAQAYLTNRMLTAKRQVELSVAGLQTQLDAAQAQLKAVTDKVSSLVDGSPDKVYADSQRNVVVSQINDLASRLAPLQTAAATPGQIITDAPLPATASSPIPALDLGGGLVVGLLLGLAAAVGLDRRDHRLRRPADVTRLVGLPVLADVPVERTPGTLPGDTQGPIFDRLRNTLVGAEPTTAAVQVSDTGGHGASAVVALQLSRSLVRSSNNVVLVVAHPSSALPALTGAQGRPGLSDVLRGDLTLGDVCVRVPALPGVTLLPPGRDPQDLEALLQSRALTTVLASLRTSACVVLETSGTGESAAAQAVAAHSDACVVVAERGRTGGDEVQEAAQAAARMGTTVSGVVLVPAASGKAAKQGRQEPAPQNPARSATQERPTAAVGQAAPAPVPAGGGRACAPVDEPAP